MQIFYSTTEIYSAVCHPGQFHFQPWWIEFRRSSAATYNYNNICIFCLKYHSVNVKTCNTKLANDDALWGSSDKH